MRHLTRDFLTLASASCPGTNMYALAIFLIGCGGFSLVGQTNFGVFSGSLEVANGISASITPGPMTGQATVSLPTASYLVSNVDVDRILVLKSQEYPRSNSGLFRVIDYNQSSNALTIDYRASTSAPSEQYLNWRLYFDEVTASQYWTTGSNGTSKYGSYTPHSLMTASTSRAVLRSPDPTSWQVRLCLESLQDVSGACPSGFSIAPGFGGNGNGDFFPIPSTAGPGYDQRLHLHTALYHDTTESKYRGMVVGLTPCLTASSGAPLWVPGQWRISMIVDDVSGSCAIINRNVSLPTVGSGSGWAAFGLCENEQRYPNPVQISDPSYNCPRLFVVGSSRAQSNMTWTSQFHDDNHIQVVGFAKRGYPIPGVLSCYSDISNPNNGHQRYLTASVNTPWLSATELLDVEVLIGTIDQTVSASTPETFFPLQPRRLGRLPFFLQGRANYPQWTAPASTYGEGYLATSLPYLHTVDGIFMEWGGPAPSDVLTGSSVFVISGAYESQEGLRPYGAFLPGSDPVPDEIAPRILDIDATRYRKTYSYYRQVPVPVSVVKGGSNPAKP